ncbi:MAG: hypothetical protein H0W14_04145 [Actinobacteria bacterium]|nr:hypothetical protein [Actinomycetota bacterium]
MTLDPQIALLGALTMAVGFTMYYAGLKKNMLELKQRRRICPACGRRITGRVCNAH